VNDTLIGRGLFSTILNGDGVVQIGTNIFRVDKTYAKVFVLPLADIAYYNDLIATYPQSGKVYMFSIGDNVLEQIAAGALNQTVVSTVDLLPVSGAKGKYSIRIRIPPIFKTPFCDEAGMGGYDTYTLNLKLDNAGLITMQGKLHYNRYGIYFSLFAEVQATQNGFAELTIDLDPVYYHVRCGNTVGPYISYGNGGGDTFGYKKYQSYQASTNLNQVNFRGRFHAKITLPSGVLVKDTEWIQIRVNC
jgi:hypothetical protein